MHIKINTSMYLRMHMHRYAVLFMTLCKEDELPGGAVHLVATFAKILEKPWGVSCLTLH